MKKADAKRLFIGGLEVVDPQRMEVVTIGGVDHCVIENFKCALRNNILDWSTFLEVYRGKIPERVLFEQVLQVLNIRQEKVAPEELLELLKTVYLMPADTHLVCMTKQFNILRPFGEALYSLFQLVLSHYEAVVRTFVETRNRYLRDQSSGLDHIKTSSYKDAKNNWDELLSGWEKENQDRNLQSSSVILLFLNPPGGLESGLRYETPGAEKECKALKTAVAAFRYQGFCPKVPEKRLCALFEFPLKEFVVAIRTMDPKVRFPDYGMIETAVSSLIARAPKPPSVVDKYPRKDPPKKLLAGDQRPALIKWYMQELLALRKHLLPQGEKLEQHYMALARLIMRVVEKLEGPLRDFLD